MVTTPSSTTSSRADRGGDGGNWNERDTKRPSPPGAIWEICSATRDEGFIAEMYPKDPGLSRLAVSGAGQQPATASSNMAPPATSSSNDEFGNITFKGAYGNAVPAGLDLSTL